ncbi:hypothetical protein LCGC14_0761500 [marine sediment metagenome]|uniref:Uncharacterized protein n=1 Tax=marine sediment metagenome TaxID=412755 RepID=A0A0F9Q146_9ZZZZ
MATNPDQIGELATRGAAMNDIIDDTLALMPGESTISADELAAHYLMMNFEQRGQLFNQLIIAHGPKGITMAREVYVKAIKLFQGQA